MPNEMKPDIPDWLNEQCSRLKYGQCTTRRCLVRGGYTGPPASPDIATCEAYEISTKLDEQAVEVKVMRAALEELFFMVNDAEDDGDALLISRTCSTMDVARAALAQHHVTEGE